MDITDKGYGYDITDKDYGLDVFYVLCRSIPTLTFKYSLSDELLPPILENKINKGITYKPKVSCNIADLYMDNCDMGMGIIPACYIELDLI